MLSETAFFMDMLELYRSKKRLIDRKLSLHWTNGGEARIRYFCADIRGSISYANTCKLALVFANVTGSRMPDHIHSRIVLGEANEWASEYVRYASAIKPSILGINRNTNNFNRHTIHADGQISRTYRK
jgi:hypothetical protein